MGAQEGFERLFARLAGNEGEHAQRGDLVGHIVGILQLGHRAFGARLRIAGRKKVERDVAAGALAGARRVRRIGVLRSVRLVEFEPLRGKVAADLLAQRLACREDRVRIDILADLARDVGLARQGDRLGGEGGIGRVAGEQAGDRRNEARVLDRRRAGADRRDGTDEEPGRIGLRRLPAVERVAVVMQQGQKIVLAEVEIEPHRRRKAAQQGSEPAAPRRRGR